MNDNEWWMTNGDDDDEDDDDDDKNHECNHGYQTLLWIAFITRFADILVVARVWSGITLATWKNNVKTSLMIMIALGTHERRTQIWWWWCWNIFDDHDDDMNHYCR